MTRLRNRTSRRAPPLRDSDYDHEIHLINNEDHTAAVVVDEPRPVLPPPSVTVTASGQLASDQNDATGTQSALVPVATDVVDVPPAAAPMTMPTSTSQPPPPPPKRKPRSTASTSAAVAAAAAIVAAEPTAAVDILYENERGGFLCGIPLFSSLALGNLDPSPWTNAAGKTSPTDIHTAQVPDPSWQWAWPAWRIHHAAGTDEGGWEYSFMFAKAFSWHGPTWYSSFVRRRVWLRKRVKRSVAASETAAAGLAVPSRVATPHSGDGASAVADDINSAVTDPHLLNPDYFIVLPAAEMRRSSSRASGTSRASRVSRTSRPSRSSACLYPVDGGQRDGAAEGSEGAFSDEEGPTMPAEIDNADILLGFLYDARIDREKIEAVDNFLAHADEDLVRLQDIMHEIMAQFVFQAPRRLLLSHLQAAYDKAVAAMQAEEGRDKGKGPELAEKDAADTAGPEHTHRRQTLERRVGYLAAAVQHADEEVRRLEYWSDIKAMAKDRPADAPVDEMTA